MRGRRLYQAVAEASAENARLLIEDGRALRRRGSVGHACALAILGMEEAAKALVYKQAAEGVIRLVRRNPNNLSTYSEKDLLNHKFKHGAITRLLIGSVEFAPFLQTLAASRKKVFSREDVVVILRRAHTRQWLQKTELERGGQAAKELQKMLRTLARLDGLKNDALYVGRVPHDVRHPNGIPPKEVSDVWEIANSVVKAAEETVATPFSKDQRREFAEQLRILSTQSRRLKRLAAKKSPNSNSSIG
ncbi:MAG: AbiV family abortive infection protein [Thermoplasmata archaeon]